MQKKLNETDLPDYEIEALAKAFLPLILKHFRPEQKIESDETTVHDSQKKVS